VVENRKKNSRSLHGTPGQVHFATPDFLWILVALADSHAPFLKEKGAHAALSSAAWQEIRVRSGRDDTSVGLLRSFLWPFWPFSLQKKCVIREVVTFLIFLIFGTPNRNVFQNSHKTVILRACDFLDLSCLPHIQLAVLQAPQQSRHPESL
jgi:hypothetical protein